MNFNNFEYDLKDAVRKLRLSSDNVKAQAFDILNKGYRSMETDEVKSEYINDILSKSDLTFFKMEDIINLLIFAENIKLDKELYDKIEDEIYEEVPKEKWGVHETHCCSTHGCKYGNPKCPVLNGSIKQKYPCEFCEEDEFDELCRNANC